MAKTTQSPFRAVAETKKRLSPFEQWREKRQERTLNWADVHPTAAIVAMAATTQAGGTLVFSPAMGGMGFCLRVWHGDDKWTEYAANADQLNQLLELVIDHYASQSEDIYLALGIDNPFASEKP
jgi:phage terminase large subunit-like protein